MLSNNTVRGRKIIGTALLAAGAALLWLSTSVKADDPAPSLADQAHAIFTKNCVKCHGKTHPAKNIDLTNRDSAVNAKAIIPKDAAHSKLIEVVENGSMPVGGPKLSKEDISTLKQWIDAGAADWAPPKQP